jgi:tripartite-type tricarboxylate transporter receptor subunit TctC
MAPSGTGRVQRDQYDGPRPREDAGPAGAFPALPQPEPTSMRHLLRPLLLVLSASVALAASCAASAADAYPSKPIKVLVGYSAGGAVDASARSVGQQLSKTLGQPVIVENRPGGGTNIAVKGMISSAPDGYTLLMSANALAVNPSLFEPAPFDLDKDITPVALVGRVPVVFAVRDASPLHTVADLVAAAKAKPSNVSVATPGNGSTPHLAMELFQHTAGVKLLHVPYKGGAPALTDLLGGHVDVVAVNALEVLPLAKAGKLRVLAVMSADRSPVLPTVPTVAESGYKGFEANVWYGLVAPASTPPAVVKAIQQAVQKALATPEVRDQLAAAGGKPLPGTSADFAALIKSDAARYGKLIRDDGIKLE